MSSQHFVGFLIFLMTAVMVGMMSFAEGYKYYVGGRDGWVTNPTESFNQWAERNRFQVNDILYFKYEKGSDSVLVVNKEDYFSCNTTNPIQSFTDGNSEFKFNYSGAFYFISGNEENCNKGHKLIVVVLAVRNKQYTSPSPSPSPSEIDSPSPFSGSSPGSEAPEAGGDLPSDVGGPTSLDNNSPPPLSASSPGSDAPEAGGDLSSDVGGPTSLDNNSPSPLSVPSPASMAPEAGGDLPSDVGGPNSSDKNSPPPLSASSPAPESRTAGGDDLPSDPTSLDKNSPPPLSASSPASESPKAGGDIPSDVGGPTSSEKNWGSLRSEVATWLVAVLSVGVSIVLCSFIVV